MPRIAEDTIQRVAAASDIVDVIGSMMQLKRAGAMWKGLCPFHNEKTPSFTVNPARQTFKCFGCGEGGTVFSFVMKYENVDFPAAARRLAARASIPIAEESPGDEERRGERDRMLALHRDAATWLHENLMRRKIAAGARDYLKGRGINSEIAGRWRLGYAPDEWSALADWGRGAGYTEAELLAAGLVLARERGGGTYDRFRNRVMFPICNDYGDVIGFSGRTLGDDPAKYVNSPETMIFTKGRVLFGLEKTKRSIIDANEAIVCEGQLDLISAFEAGVQNLTAPQGTAFTPQQARLLRRFAESVVLCFDSDAAGRKAVERSLPALLAVGLTVRVARVPAGEDPDSLVQKQGAGALREVVAAASDYFDNTLEEELAPGATPRQRATLARKLAGFVRLIEDPALREAVTTRVRSRLELTDAGFAELLRSAPNPSAEPESEVPESVETLVLPEPARVLCRLAILSADARAWMRARPEPATTFGGEYRIVDRLVRTDAALETPEGFAAFTAELSTAEERALVDLHLGRAPENPVERVEDAWRGLLRGKLQEEMARLQAKIRHPDLSVQAINLLHKQILDLRERLGHV